MKDILRSYCHELFHHAQKVSGKGFGNTSGNLSENPELEKLEGEAYLNGNILFRKWTETEKSGR